MLSVFETEKNLHLAEMFPIIAEIFPLFLILFPINGIIMLNGGIH